MLNDIDNEMTKMNAPKLEVIRFNTAEDVIIHVTMNQCH